MLAAMLEGAEPRYHHLEDAPGCRRCCGQVAPALTAIMLVCVGLASSNLRPDAVAAEGPDDARLLPDEVRGARHLARPRAAHVCFACSMTQTWATVRSS